MLVVYLLCMTWAWLPPSLPAQVRKLRLQPPPTSRDWELEVEEEPECGRSAILGPQGRAGGRDLDSDSEYGEVRAKYALSGTLYRLSMCLCFSTRGTLDCSKSPRLALPATFAGRRCWTPGTSSLPPTASSPTFPGSCWYGWATGM